SQMKMYSERREFGGFELQAIHALIQRCLQEREHGHPPRRIPSDAGTQVDERRAAVFDVGINTLLAFFSTHVDLQLWHERRTRVVAHAEIDVQSGTRLETLA